MEHKYVALKVLKNCSMNELKVRVWKSLVQSKSFLEILENAIKKYHNKILTAAV
ncbi:MAG: DUF3387 domain-containing protein [Methylococcales bacterium]|nr:DUF3387 domain-containing protein [Methylococcales bacterium]